MTARRAAFAVALAALVTAAPFGPCALAEPPQIARVAGLPAGDTLSLRAEPNAKARSLATLEEGDGPIEILETVRNGRTEWARLSYGEGEAWAAKRYLEEIELEPIGETSLTVGLVCSGTEPFWAVSLSDPHQAFWRDPETGVTRPVVIAEAVGAEGRGGWPVALTLSGHGFEGVLAATPTECSDGMSDRVYPWAALVVDQTDGRPRLFEGCCGHRPERQPR